VIPIPILLVLVASTSNILEVPRVGHRMQVVQETVAVHVQGRMWGNGTNARRKQRVLHHFGIPPQGSGTARAGVVVVIIIVTVVAVVVVLVIIVVLSLLLSLWKPSFLRHEPGPALNAHDL
jgi:hypothetical protein